MNMMNNPKISIVVPVYNTEKWLKRSLDSIINQSFTDFELILVDDGSKDSSPTICDSYAALDSRVKVIHKINGGVSSARNAGIEHATGEYITFADSDDEMLPGALAEMAKFDEDVIISGILVLLQDEIREHTPQNKVYSRKEDYKHIINSHYNDACLRGPYAKSIRRTILLDNHIRFDHNLHWGEDYLFNLQLISKADSIRLIPAMTYKYYMGIGGSYKFSIDEFNYTSTIIENAISYFGNCKQAIEANRKGLYAILMCYISSHRHNQKMKLAKKILRYRIWQKFPTGRKYRSLFEISRVLFLGF